MQIREQNFPEKMNPRRIGSFLKEATHLEEEAHLEQKIVRNEKKVFLNYCIVHIVLKAFFFK